MSLYGSGLATLFPFRMTDEAIGGDSFLRHVSRASRTRGR
jgi:hypothetical protein